MEIEPNNKEQCRLPKDFVLQSHRCYVSQQSIRPSAFNIMNIFRDPQLGMCFGVRNAIALAIECATTRPVTVLGELVHNPDVLARLRHGGIQTAHEIDQIWTQDVLISAHGISGRRLGELKARGLVVWDATCPLVRAAQSAVRELAASGWHPVIVGKRDHVEVRGLTEDLEEFDIVLTEEDVCRLREQKRWGVVAQTTQPIDRVRYLVAALRNRFPCSEIRFVDTVCQTTKLRRAAALELARECEVVVVVGGVNSNNTRELAAACADHGARVYHVQSASDLRSEWFKGVGSVGLTAGTSTPDNVIDEVERQLRLIADAQDKTIGIVVGQSNVGEPVADLTAA